MVNEMQTFGSATVLTIVGLAIMLYGVSLNNGTAFNTTMGVGGVVVAVGIGIIMVAVMRLEATAEAE